MSRNKKLLVFIGVFALLITAFKLYFNYQSQQEFLQLKESFKQDDKIAVLEH